MVGHKKENVKKLKELYDVDTVIKQDDDIKLGKFEISILKTYKDFRNVFRRTSKHFY